MSTSYSPTRIRSNYLAVFVGPRISRYGRVAHTNSNNAYDGMRPAYPMYCSTAALIVEASGSVIARQEALSHVDRVR